MKQTISSRASQTRERRKPRRLRLFLMFLAGLVLLVLELIGVAFFWLVIRPLPQTDGTVEISGLSGEVKVVRDKAGVPHISASNVADLFMAQGYVTAQDRMWQLEFNRRVGAGRLSEVLGEAAIEQDRFLRTIGLRRAAESELAGLSGEEKLILESYARGINAFMETHRDNLPIEFSLLGFKPEPWTVLDTLSWGKVMAFDLGDNYGREITRAALVEKVGAAEAARLMPTGSAPTTPLIVPPNVSYKGIEGGLALASIQADLHALVGQDLDGRGSNNWVVAGAKTTTGKPMLANDPHLGLRNPSVWYEVSLQGGGFNVAGVTFPGVPGVVIGHNERIAWGVTNVSGDTQDLYLEKLNPANPDQYEFKGEWQPLQITSEEIKISGKPSETLRVRQTRHGPILNDVTDALKNSQPMALRWVALGDAPLIGSVLQYNRAQNWTAFRQALRGFNTPAQNFVYADLDGNIGYQIPGLWPLRAKGDGLLPVPGWTGEYEWTGFANFDDLPSVYNPAAGFVATANNRNVAQSAEKVYLGQEYDPGWRAQRITDLLKAKEKLSLADLGAIQADVLSIPGKEFVGYLANLPNSDGKIAPALARLRDWDGRLTADSVPGAIYKATYVKLVENMFKERLGQDLYERYANGNMTLLAVLTLLKDPSNSWWGAAGRDVLLQKSVGQAVDFLSGKLGSNEADWKWGKLHTMSFTQTPIGKGVPGPLQPLINLKTVENGGDGTTVAAASFDLLNPFAQTTGVSFRGLMNLADWDASLIVNSGGQSGQPFNKHYGDNLDDWLNGRYHPFLFSPAAVEREKEATLTLRPK